jgi:hypothetical protein
VASILVRCDAAAFALLYANLDVKVNYPVIAVGYEDLRDSVRLHSE